MAIFSGSVLSSAQGRYGAGSRRGGSIVLCALAVFCLAALGLQAGVRQDAWGSSPASRTVTEVALSPAGTQIAYVLQVRSQAGADGKSDSTELHLVSLEGDSIPLVTGEVTLRSIRWTPDEKAVSFLARRADDDHTAVYVAPLERKSMQALAYHLAEIPQNAMPYSDDEEPIGLVYHSSDILAYELSPDGERVAFLARDEESEKDEADGPVRVWIGSLEEGGPYTALELPSSVSEVRWSPTGSRLAVAVSLPSHAGGMEEGNALLVVDPETGTVEQRFTLSGKVRAVAWNKEGNRLAFVSGDGLLVAVLPTAAGETAELIDFQFPVLALAWQDADTVMFLSREGMRSTFGRVEGDGSNPRVVFSSDEVELNDFSLAASGMSAAFLGRSGAGGQDVFFMEHGDQALRRLTRSHESPPPDAAVIRRRRIDVLLPQALEEHGFDLWLVFTREAARDPIGPDIAADQVVARSAFLFARSETGFRKVAIVASYDVSPVEESGIYDKVIAYRGEGIKPHLKKIVSDLDPKRIGINISRDTPTADGLTIGMRRYLEETLGPDYSARFASAEPVVISFRGRRLPEEVALLREAAVYTDRILREALSSQVITPGQTTEREVADYLRQRTEEFGATVPFISVVVGPVRGHGGPSDRVIQPGDLVRIDFGITHRGYSTDLQRTAHVLRPGEGEPPAEIQRMWNTCRAATDAAIAAMRPGVTGNSIDTIARQVLTDAGYGGYPHAAGHPIGFDVHDVGPTLGPDWPERYGSTVHLKLEKDQTFAVEPILYADYQGVEVNIGLEEDVVVTADGVERLHPRQDELFLIRSRE